MIRLEGSGTRNDEEGRRLQGDGILLQGGRHRAGEVESNVTSGNSGV